MQLGLSTAIQRCCDMDVDVPNVMGRKCVGSSGVGIGLAPYGTRVLWLCVRGRAELGWCVEGVGRQWVVVRTCFSALGPF